MYLIFKNQSALLYTWSIWNLQNAPLTSSWAATLWAASVCTRCSAALGSTCRGRWAASCLTSETGCRVCVASPLVWPANPVTTQSGWTLLQQCRYTHTHTHTHTRMKILCCSETNSQLFWNAPGRLRLAECCSLVVPRAQLVTVSHQYDVEMLWELFTVPCCNNSTSRSWFCGLHFMNEPQ